MLWRAREDFLLPNPGPYVVHTHYICHAGKHSEAEQLYRQVLEVRERVLGPEHPDTLKTKHNLADTLQDQGKLQDTTCSHIEWGTAVALEGGSGGKLASVAGNFLLARLFTTLAGQLPPEGCAKALGCKPKA